MTQHPGKTLPPLYITAAAPCPYLPDRLEKKVFTHLLGPDAVRLNDTLSTAGFRRSQTIAYRPACDHCNACVSVRIRVDAFTPGKTFRRVLNANADLTPEILPPRTTREQFSLLRRYLDERHGDGGMADMTMMDYAAMVEETTVDTRLVEYRMPSASPQHRGKLMAVALTDRLGDGLSMVYSFFNAEETRRSLGSFMILDHVRMARAENLPFVYLGYWVKGCQKMDYKIRFTPLEALTPGGWTRFDPD